MNQWGSTRDGFVGPKDGPDEYPALGAPGAARGGVPGARPPVSVSAGGIRRSDECVAPALVSAFSRHRGNIGGVRTDSSRARTVAAGARLVGGGRDHDRDDFGDGLSHHAW